MLASLSTNLAKFSWTISSGFQKAKMTVKKLGEFVERGDLNPTNQPKKKRECTSTMPLSSVIIEIQHNLFNPFSMKMDKVNARV